MVSKQKAEASTVGQPAPGSRVVRTALVLLMILMVAGCLLAWPLDTNRQLLQRSAGLLSRHVGNYMSSQEFEVLLTFYKDAAAFRLPEQPAQKVAKAQTCQLGLGRQAEDVLFGKPMLPPLHCGAVAATARTTAVAANKPIARRASHQVAVQPVAAPAVAFTAAPAKPQQIEAIVTKSNKPKGPQPLISLRDRATCNQGASLNIVAHEDDDILFMNPDIQADIQGGRCVRTVYVTAGDAGQPSEYWMGRERGAKAAYSAMYRVENIWRDEQHLLDGRLVAVSYLQNVPEVSLLFLRLPDGNVDGGGFAASGGESLHRLLSGELGIIHTVTEHKIVYSRGEIIEALAAVMQTDRPEYIRSQSPEGHAEGDHTDHAAVGTLVAAAAATHRGLYTLSAYAGYPNRLLEPNLTPEQFGDKQAVFLAYALHDGAVCQTAEDCAATVTYGNYLSRQYCIAAAQNGQ